MTDNASREGLKNWGHGPETGRPKSVGPHDVKKDQVDPSDPGIDPEAYHLKPGMNNNRTAEDPGPGGPVNIKPKGK